MKEFITAVEDVIESDEREAKIKALMAEGKSREDAEAEVEEDKFSEFKLDGRVMRAYQPHEGQLTFMLAAMGRGQTNDQRFAAIINIMMESLRDSDRDYFESRLLTRDRKKRLAPKQVEEIFEHLMSEWFRSSVPDDGTAL